MSGGSWDYICFKMDEAADSLENDVPIRRALGKKLRLFAKAMHDIEWVDSSDMSPGDEIESIKKALGDNSDELVLSEIIEDARKIKKELEHYGV